MQRLTHPVRAVRGAVLTMRDATTIVFYADGGVAWDHHGRITHVDAWAHVAPQLASQTIVDHWPGHVITPGFIDCHVHLPQLDCRNRTGCTLLDWLEQYIFPAEARFSDPRIARDTAERFFHALLQHGTTTAMIFSTTHETATDIAFEVAEAAGVRAIIGKVMMDQHSPSALLETTAASLQATERLITKWHKKTDRLFYAVTPRFALTCTEPLLREAGALATSTGVFFQTHIAETRDEIARAHTLFPTMDSYVDLFARCGCVGPRRMFAHAIHLTDHEWAALAATNSAVAHCPSSNIFLRSGRMPYEQVQQHQIACGLGSDVGAGPEFSLWDVMRCGRAVHPAEIFSLAEGFYRATLGGATALGFSDALGALAPGYRADLAIFPYTGILETSAILRQLTHQQVPRPVSATYIHGEQRYLAAHYR